MATNMKDKMAALRAMKGKKSSKPAKRKKTMAVSTGEKQMRKHGMSYDGNCK